MSMAETEHFPVSERWPDGIVPMGEYEDACNDRDRYRRALEQITDAGWDGESAADTAREALERRVDG